MERCSIDTEWSTQLRPNGGPGKKIGKVAVVSICYLTPDADQKITAIEDLLVHCRAAVFQISSLPRLPDRLVDILQTPTVKKTGKNIQISDGKYLKEDWGVSLHNWEVNDERMKAITPCSFPTFLTGLLLLNRFQDSARAAKNKDVIRDARLGLDHLLRVLFNTRCSVEICWDYGKG